MSATSTLRIPPNRDTAQDTAHLRAEVARLRQRVQELLEANGRLKDERTEARTLAIALDRELELLRPEFGRVLLDNTRLREYLFPSRSEP